MGINWWRSFLIVLCCVWLLSLSGCKRHVTARPAFYFWKTAFELNNQEAHLLHTAADNRLYLRFFDVVWSDQQQQALPDGILAVRQPLDSFSITPVIYITNQSLQRMGPAAIDSLAARVNRLLNRLSTTHGILYQQVQIDCDWSVATKTKYFTFLRAFKRYNGKTLQATIRLHQIKYPERTGVPPVDKGVLMFYNMGSISADLHARNSIYNKEDAGAYLAAIPNYQLPLDVALPVFSWAIQIRAGKVIQLYAKIGLQQLSDSRNFKPVNLTVRSQPCYQALKSFYSKGVYIKKGDVFKFEGIDSKTLALAAQQLSGYLKVLQNRNIIYYEISSTSLSKIYAKDIKEISALF
jgi:hypothetical protein